MSTIWADRNSRFALLISIFMLIVIVGYLTGAL